MEPQEQELRTRIQAVIDGTEPPATFADWFEPITWLIRPPHMRPLVHLVALTTARVAVYQQSGCTGDELRGSLTYVLAAVDKRELLPADPLADRTPMVSTPKMRPVQNG